jgi:hypothetical protein
LMARVVVVLFLGLSEIGSKHLTLRLGSVQYILALW